MSGLELLVHVLAVHRLTQLVVADRVTRGLRWWLIARVYGQPVDDCPNWDELVLADDEAPAVAYLITCWWCTGLWAAILWTGLWNLWTDGWWHASIALAAASVSVLVHRVEQSLFTRSK